MSSTDQDLEVDSLFDEVLLPLAAKAGSEPPFPLGPDPSLATYFVRCAKPSMTRDDFTAPSCIGFDDFEKSLAAYWLGEGKPELAALAPRFARAAKIIHAPAAEGAEVSTFIYVMF